MEKLFLLPNELEITLKSGIADFFVGQQNKKKKKDQNKDLVEDLDES